MFSYIRSRNNRKKDIIQTWYTAWNKKKQTLSSKIRVIKNTLDYNISVKRWSFDASYVWISLFCSAAELHSGPSKSPHSHRHPRHVQIPMEDSLKSPEIHAILNSLDYDVSIESWGYDLHCIRLSTSYSIVHIHCGPRKTVSWGGDDSYESSVVWLLYGRTRFVPRIHFSLVHSECVQCYRKLKLGYNVDHNLSFLLIHHNPVNSK